MTRAARDAGPIAERICAWINGSKRDRALLRQVVGFVLELAGFPGTDGRELSTAEASMRVLDELSVFFDKGYGDSSLWWLLESIRVALEAEPVPAFAPGAWERERSSFRRLKRTAQVLRRTSDPRRSGYALLHAVAAVGACLSETLVDLARASARGHPVPRPGSSSRRAALRERVRWPKAR